MVLQFHVLVFVLNFRKISNFFEFWCIMCCEEDQYTESHTNLNSLKPIFLTVSIKHAEPIPSPPLLLASISSPWAPIQKPSPWHTRFSLHKIFQPHACLVISTFFNGLLRVCRRWVWSLWA